jgi:hypothetical protein
MTKIAGSGSESGSISQRHGSADPDPDPRHNVMDPEHWFKVYKNKSFLFIFCILGKSSTNLREDDEERFGLHVIFPLLVL